MVPRRSIPVVLLWVLFVPLLSGCLGNDAEVAPGPAADDVDMREDEAMAGAEAEDPRLDLGMHNISLAPWFAPFPPVVAEPRTAGMLQVDGLHQDGVLLRLLYDGSAFVLTGRPTKDASAFDDTVWLTRIVAPEYGIEVARNHTHIASGDGGGFVMALPAYDRIRMRTEYTLEVYGFRWSSSAEIGCPDPDGCSPPPSDPIGRLVRGAPQHDHDAQVTEADPRTVWQTPLSLTSRAEVTIEGPAEGTDRPDAVESKYLLGPETETYTVTVTGRRIWQANMLLEFQDSRIYASRPEVYGNGSRALDVYLVGHRPLDVWRSLPADEGFDQTFQVMLDIDLETGHGDLPEDGDQFFLATVQHGYRIDGTTYVRGSAGDDLMVRVRAR